MDDTTWKIISRCVNERAALLVMIAGPRFMPHAIDSEAGRALVPAEIDYGHRQLFQRRRARIPLRPHRGRSAAIR